MNVRDISIGELAERVGCTVQIIRHYEKIGLLPDTRRTSGNRRIFCGGDRTEIARTDFTIYFSEFEYSTGSICKSCYHANAKVAKAV